MRQSVLGTFEHHTSPAVSALHAWATSRGCWTVRFPFIGARKRTVRPFPFWDGSARQRSRFSFRYVGFGLSTSDRAYPRPPCSRLDPPCHDPRQRNQQRRALWAYSAHGSAAERPGLLGDGEDREGLVGWLRRPSPEMAQILSVHLLEHRFWTCGEDIADVAGH